MADDRLTTLISSVPPDRPYFSLEFFPPKTQSGFINLQARLARMAKGVRPLFVTVTWGAGGSTSAKSLELAEVSQRQLGLPTVLHLTCTNMKKTMVDEALEACKELGVRNILALRGDPPREEYREEATDQTDDSNEEFVWAVDLVRYIRQNHGDWFCIGVAGYPEGHADESHPVEQSIAQDLPFLVEKIKAGANFIMTQLTYDIDAYAKYERILRNFKDNQGNAVFEHIPIAAGIMPIQSASTLNRITKLSHARLPSSISDRISQVKNDDEAVQKVGIDILSELVEGIKDLPRPKTVPRGFHFYTLNLEKTVTFILERSDLIPPVREPSPEESSDSDAIIDDDKKLVNGTGQPTPRFSRRRASSVNAQPHNRVILDSKSPDRPKNQERQQLVIQHETRDRGSGIPADQPTQKDSLLISEGKGSLGREASWDQYVNGRWGPSDSPAYGEIDGYSASLKVGPACARKLWGHPKSVDHVTDIFRRHILGEVESCPWSDTIDPDPTIKDATALRPETASIRNELLGLIDKGYWTIASQPACDGADSSQEHLYWGPPGGWVFGKPFVEMFVSRSHFETHLKPKLLAAPADEISWLKTDYRGLFESSDEIASIAGSAGLSSPKRSRGSCVCSWGVFKNKEIVASTIIESESFRAFAVEGYAIWESWRRCFPKGSEEEKCLEAARRDVVLVNIVSHLYVGEDGGKLWKWLLED